MEMASVFEKLYFALNGNQHMIALLLGMPRLFLLVTVAPFFGNTVITGQLRMVLVLAMYLPIHPVLITQIPEIQTFTMHYGLELAALLLKEVLLGLFLGFLGGIVFWTIQSAGFFIDNQRGASMAEASDVLSGDQTSPTGGLLFQSLTYLFFTTGAFLSFLGVVYSTYEFWPVASALPFVSGVRLPLYFAAQLGWLLANMMLLAGPIIVACLLTDVSLGLVNRFASQLNVYVLAMPIKSALASFLLCFYFALLLSHAPQLFSLMNAKIVSLSKMLLP